MILDALKRLENFTAHSSGVSRFTNRTRILLWLVIAQGFTVALYVLVFPSIQAGDFQAYYFAGRRALVGDPFVNLKPPTGLSTKWVYPPISVIYYLPFSLLPSWQTAFIVEAFVITLMMAATGYILRIEYLPDSLSKRDEVLFVIAIIANPFSVMNLAQGQMNARVLFFIVIGLYWLRSNESVKGGVAIAAAALTKIWPALLGMWLLYERDWRAIGAATVTGIGGLVAGIIVFGVGTTETYLFDVLMGRSRLGRLTTGVSPNDPMIALVRPLSMLAPGGSAAVYTIVAVVLLLMLLLGIYWISSVEAYSLSLAGFSVCIILLATPASTFPWLLVPLATGLTILVTAQDWLPKLILAAGVLISGVPIGLEEFVAVVGVIGYSIQPTASLSFIFATAPPYIIGLILLTTGHILASDPEWRTLDLNT